MSKWREEEEPKEVEALCSLNTHSVIKLLLLLLAASKQTEHPNLC